MKKSRYFLLVLLVLLITITPLLSTGLVTNDDLWNHFYATNFGFKYCLMRVLGIMIAQGRLYFNVFLFEYIPFVVNNFVYFKFVQIGFLILDMILLSFFISLILGKKKIFSVVFVLALIFLQNTWEHNAISAFPGLITISSAFLFSSFIFCFFSQKNKSRKMLVLSVFFYLVTLFTYEAYVIYLPVFFLIILMFKKRIFLTLKFGLPYFLIMFFYLLTYFLFRLRFGSGYGGVIVQNNIDLLAILKVIKQFSFSAIPGYVYLNPKYSYLLGIFNDSLYGFSGWRSVFKELQIQWVVKGILVFYICFNLLKDGLNLNRKKMFFCVVVSIFYFFSPAFLLSLTQHYQDSVIKDNQLGMPVTFFCYLAFTVGFLFSFLLIKSFIKNKFLSRLLLLIFCVICFLISLSTDYANYYFDKSQTLSRYKWETIDRFINIDKNISLKDGDIIYAPSLLSRIGSDATDEKYWTDYLAAKLGKSVVVVKDLSDDLIGNGYVLFYKQKTKDLEQYLLFGLVSGIDNDEDILIDNPCIYNFSKYDEYSIIGQIKSKTKIKIETDFGKNVLTDNYFSFNVDKYNYIELDGLKRTCLIGSGFLLDSFIINIE